MEGITMETVNRGWLKRQVLKGKVEARCSHHLTDDYLFDVANKYGVTGWMPARISHPVYEEYENDFGYKRSRCADYDFIEGQMNFHDFDFEGKSGGAYRQPDGTIHFYIHSNASYELRLIA
jgi:hypothetical protein